MANEDFLFSQIAKMYYVDGIKQNEIARRFNITSMMVSRYLRKAEQKGIVTIHIKMPWAQDVELGRNVREKFGLGECVALEVPRDGNVRVSLAKFFADYFSNLVKSDMIISTSWGKTIAEFASVLPFVNVSGCSVLQLNGAFWSDDSYIMPSQILQQISQKLNARSYPMNTPLYVDSVATRDKLMNDPINIAVQDLASRADIAIVGASALTREATTIITNPIVAQCMDELAQKGSIGDFAGVFLDKNGDLLKWSNAEMYMGVSLPRIAMAKNVVCLAGGVEKAPVLAAAAKKRYYHTLITSKETAQAMLQFH